VVWLRVNVHFAQRVTIATGQPHISARMSNAKQPHPHLVVLFTCAQHVLMTTKKGRAQKATT
jgi:hypothetical protein